MIISNAARPASLHLVEVFDGGFVVVVFVMGLAAPPREVGVAGPKAEGFGERLDGDLVAVQREQGAAAPGVRVGVARVVSDGGVGGRQSFLGWVHTFAPAVE